MIELKSDQDFIWYKRKLDADKSHEHKHFGMPLAYPCRVESSLTDDWGLTIHRGPDEYYHSFIYERNLKCEHCGHITKTWDQPTEDGA